MQPLDDRERDELQALLDRVPAPLEPLDVDMLDGYLCGVLVQPRRVPALRWLAHVTDVDGRALPKYFDAARLQALVRRRHAELDDAIERRQWFDPWVFELADEDADGERSGPEIGHEHGRDHAPRHGGQVDTGPVDDRNRDHTGTGMGNDSHGAADDGGDDDGGGDTPGASAVDAVYPWVAGFATALELFPGVMALDAGSLTGPLALVYRHLGPDDLEDADELLAEIESLEPPADLAEAVEGLVRATLLLADIARPLGAAGPGVQRSSGSGSGPGRGPGAGRQSDSGAGSGSASGSRSGSGSDFGSGRRTAPRPPLEPRRRKPSDR